MLWISGLLPSVHDAGNCSKKESTVLSPVMAAGSAGNPVATRSSDNVFL